MLRAPYSKPKKGKCQEVVLIFISPLGKNQNFMFLCSVNFKRDMKVQVIIERGADGTFDANMEFINSIPFGLLGQGKTVSEAIDDFYNSCRL